MRGTRRNILIVVAMATLLVFALGATATATTAIDGPTPPEVGDPDTGNVVPHSGYSASTDYSMQCHEVHNAAGSYALMAEVSVTATCNTCHGLAGIAGMTGTVGGSGALPGFGAPGTTNGTASSRTAFDIASAPADHGIGGTTIPHGAGGTVTQSDWSYGWKHGMTTTDAATAAGAGTAAELTGGLYCASCHTPHGEYGQMVNHWAADATLISYEWPADQPTSGDAAGWADAYTYNNAGTWQICRDVTLLNCMDATIADEEGQTVYLFGYKLLSAYPNHTYSTLQSYKTEQYNHDGQDWCGACHVNDSSTSAAHNDSTGCSACHGNPVDQTVPSIDFPHTSTVGSFLIDYPDALCIDCHTPGSLP